MNMLAEIRIDPQDYEQRRTRRRAMRLRVESANASAAASATVRNLSETGLLIEADEAFAVGDTLTVKLPMAGAIDATVIWARAPFYGCEFAQRVSRAVISTALLRSPIDEPAVALLGPVDTTWQLPEAAAAPLRHSSGGALASLVVLGSAISLMVLALATFQTV
ncbi:MAG: PilZ domain-containing protein [Novosphingobium sp.]|nr:PilZ domain-containing protein [Novosphingobium sp.]